MKNNINIDKLRKVSISVLIFVMAIVVAVTGFGDVLKADASLSKPTVSNGNVYVVVPETIYLEPDLSSAKKFMYYVNNTLNGTSITYDAVSNDKKGKFYFKCENATDITVSVSGATVTLSQSNGSGTINAGTLSSGLKQNESSVITWTFSYKLNGKSRTVNAYTTCYAPNCSAVIAGVSSGSTNDGSVYASQLLWWEGVHSSSTDGMGTTGIGSRAETDKGMYPDSSKFVPIKSIIQSPTGNNAATWLNDSSSYLSKSAWYVKDYRNGGGDWHTVACTSPVASISYDPSRVNNINQIPYLKAGMMITDLDGSTTRRSYKIWLYSDSTFYYGYITDDKTHNSVTLQGKKSSDHTLIQQAYETDSDRDTTNSTNKGDWSTTGLKYQSCPSFPVGTSGSSISLKSAVSSSVKKDRWTSSVAYSKLNIIPVNKKDLRDYIQSIQQTGLFSDEYTGSSWSTFSSNLSDAYKILGKPNATTTEVSDAKTNLSNAKNGLVKKTSTAYAKYYNENTGKEIDSSIQAQETISYSYGDTVQVNYNDLSQKGFTFINKIVVEGATDGIEDIKDSNAKIIGKKVNRVTCDNLTFKLYYKPLNSKVKFNTNSATSDGTLEIDAEIDSSMPPITLPLRTGYTFDGYYDSNGTKYYNANGSSNHIWDKKDGGTLTAKWIANIYKITYDYHGATGGNSSTGKDVTYDLTYGTLPTPTRTGYKFAGWYNAASDGSNITSSTKVSITSDQTLHARWNVVPHTLDIDSNEGKNSGNLIYMNNGAKTVSGSYTTSGVTLTYSASYDANNNITITGSRDKAFSPNDTEIVLETQLRVKLEKGKSYTISYDSTNSNVTEFFLLNDFPSEVGNSTYSYRSGGFSNSTTTCSKNFTVGDTSNSWYIDTNKTTNDSVSSGLKTYRIRLDQNRFSGDGKFTITNLKIVENSSSSGFDNQLIHQYGNDIVLFDPIRTGYDLSSWTFNQVISTSSSDGKTTFKMPDSNVTAKANWTKKKFEFDLNGWLDGASSGNISGFGTADIKKNSTAIKNDVSDFCEDYEYQDTYEITDIKAVKGHSYVGVHSGSLTGTINLSSVSTYLEFVTNKYTVRFNANGGSGTVNNLLVTYNNTATMTAVHSLTGYTLQGYYTHPSGGIKVFNADKSLALENKKWTLDPAYDGFNSVSFATGYDSMSKGTNGATITLYAQWKANSRTVTINPNGGTYKSSSANTTETYDFSNSVSLSSPTRTGYIFNGWENYSVSIPNGAGETSFTKTSVESGGYTNYKTVVTSPISADTWKFITFAGPYDALTGDTITVKGKIRVNSTKVGLNVYNGIKSNDYSYSKPIVSTSTATGTWIDFESSRTITESDKNKNVAGYIQLYSGNMNGLNGTVIDFDIKDVQITVKHNNLSSFYMPDHNVSLKATWTPIVYTVKYSNGSPNATITSNLTADSHHTYNDEAKTVEEIAYTDTSLRSNGFKATNTVTFNWNDKNLYKTTGGTYGSDKTDVETKDLTWTGWKNGSTTYTNLSHKNLATVNKTTVTMTAQWSYPQFTAPTPTRDGYNFLGWYDQASGGTLIVAAGVTFTPNSNKTLYAHWSSTSGYTIKFNENDGSTQFNLFNTMGTKSAEEETKDGWFTERTMKFYYTPGTSSDNGYKGSLVVEGKSHDAKFIKWATLVNWNADNYIIEADSYTDNGSGIDVIGVLFGSDNSDGSKFLAHGFTQDKSLVGPLLITSVKSGTNTGIKGSQSAFTGNSFYFKMYFDLPVNKDGVYQKINIGMYHGISNQEFGKNPDNVSVPSRAGYQFSGYWTKNGTDTEDWGTQYYNEKGEACTAWHETSKNVTLYAKWEKNGYTVSYNGNGSTGVKSGPNPMDTSKHYTDESKALNLNTYVRKYNVTFNYNNDLIVKPDGSKYIISGNKDFERTFKNWNSNADGKGTSYTNGQSVVNLSTTPNDTVTLFAQWNNADVLLPTVSDSDFPGYHFEGWYTAASGGTKIGGSGETYNVALTGNTTYYAHWSAKTFDVTFDEQNGIPYNIFDMSTDSSYVKGNGSAGVLTANRSSQNQNYMDTAGVWNASDFIFKASLNATGSNSAWYFFIMNNGSTEFVKHRFAAENNIDVVSGGTHTQVGGVGAGQNVLYFNTNNGQYVGNYNNGDSGQPNKYSSNSEASIKFKIWQNSGNTNSKNYKYNLELYHGIQVAYNTTPKTVKVPTWDGYDFLGYYTGATDGDKIFNADGTAATNNFRVSGNTKLYAHWKPKTYYLDVNWDYTDKDGANRNIGNSTGFSTVTVTDDHNSITSANVDVGNFCQLVSNTYKYTMTAKVTDTSKYIIKKNDGSYGTTETRTATMPAHDVSEVFHLMPVYKIAYNANDISVNSDPESSITTTDLIPYDKSYKLASSGITLPGYTLTGWNTQANGNGTAYGLGADVSKLLTGEPGSTVTLYAQWRADTYTVTFNEQKDDLPYNLYNVNYSCKANNDNLSLSINGGSVTCKGSMKADKYCNMLSIDLKTPFNGSTSARDYILTTSAITGSRDDTYFVVEFFSDTKCENKLSPEIFFELSSDSASTRILTLPDNCQGMKFYYKNHHSLGRNPNFSFSISMTHGFNISYGQTKSVKCPTREGYKFAGYYTQASGGDKVFDENGNLNSSSGWKISSNKTLYAHWEAYSYTVKFNGNGNTNTTVSMDNLTRQIGDLPYTLPSNKFEKKYKVTLDYNNNLTVDSNGKPYNESHDPIYSSYEFQYWSGSNGVTYTNGQSVTADMTKTKDAVVTLTANWKSTSVNLPTPADRPGYTFDGWYDKAGNKASSSYTPSSNVTLYANWSAKSYDITFDEQIDGLPYNLFNLGSGASFNHKGVTYSFLNDKLTTSGTTYSDDSDVDLFQNEIWNANDYIFKADTSSVSGNMDGTWAYTILYTDYTSSKSEYVKYRFYRDNSFYNPYFARDLSAGTYSDKTNYVYYNTYASSNDKVKFKVFIDTNKNKSMNFSCNIYLYHGIQCSFNDLPKSVKVPTNSGYEFGGYWTGKNGTGKQYFDSNGDPLTEFIEGKNTTLYAYWKPYTYYVAFNGNGTDTVHMDNQEMTIGKAENLKANTYVRNGAIVVNYNDADLPNESGNPYNTPSDSLSSSGTFNGWATSPSGAVVYSNCASVKDLTLTKNDTFTLYANWTMTPVKLPNPGERVNCKFLGWWSSPSGGTKLGEANETVTLPGEVTEIYAHWSGEKCRIIFDEQNGTPVNLFELADASVKEGGITYSYYGGYMHMSGKADDDDNYRILVRETENLDDYIFTASDYNVVTATGGTWQYINIGSSVSDTDEFLRHRFMTEQGITKPELVMNLSSGTYSNKETGNDDGLRKAYNAYTGDKIAFKFYMDTNKRKSYELSYAASLYHGLDTYYGAVTKNVKTPSKAGYVFDGYWTEENGEGKQYFDGDGKATGMWLETGTTTLYAHWLKRYTISEGDNLISSNAEGTQNGLTYKYDAETGILTLNGTPDDNIFVVKIPGTWSGSYLISSKRISGSVTDSNGSDMGCPVVEFRKDGSNLATRKKLEGLNTASSVVNLAAGESDELAIWVWFGDGNSTSFSNYQVRLTVRRFVTYYHVKSEYKLGGSSMPGQVFLGWAVEEMEEDSNWQKNKYYLAGDSVKGLYGDVVLKAIWEQDIVSVNLDLYKGTGSTVPQYKENLIYFNKGAAASSGGKVSDISYNASYGDYGEILINGRRGAGTNRADVNKTKSIDMDNVMVCLEPGNNYVLSFTTDKGYNSTNDLITQFKLWSAEGKYSDMGTSIKSRYTANADGTYTYTGVFTPGDSVGESDWSEGSYGNKGIFYLSISQKFFTENGYYNITDLRIYKEGEENATKLYQLGSTQKYVSAPFRKGYDFKGWTIVKVNGNPNGKLSSDGMTYTFGSDKSKVDTLLANWKESVYYIKYNNVGEGETDGSMKDSTFTYDSSDTSLESNAYSIKFKVTYEYNGETLQTYDAYSLSNTAEFRGWSYSSNYLDESITIDFNNNGKFGNGNIQDSDITPDSDGKKYVQLYTVWGDASVKLTSPTRLGYKFDGWYYDSNFTEKAGNGGQNIQIKCNETLYAKWKKLGVGNIVKAYDYNENYNFRILEDKDLVDLPTVGLTITIGDDFNGTVGSPSTSSHIRGKADNLNNYTIKGGSSNEKWNAVQIAQTGDNKQAYDSFVCFNAGSYKKAVTFYYEISFTADGVKQYISGTITLVPANNVYYGDDAFTYDTDSFDSSNNGSSWTRLEGTIPASKVSGSEAKTVYGGKNATFDGSASDSYSYGVVHYSFVSQSEQISKASEFSFDGNGFDLYSSCNYVSPAYMIYVWDKSTATVNSLTGKMTLTGVPIANAIVDTYVNDRNLRPQGGTSGGSANIIWDFSINQTSIYHFSSAEKGEYLIQVYAVWLDTKATRSPAYATEEGNNNTDSIISQLESKGLKVYKDTFEMKWFDEDSILNGGNGESEESINTRSKASESIPTNTCVGVIDGIRVYGAYDTDTASEYHNGYESAYIDSEKNAAFYNIRQFDRGAKSEHVEDKQVYDETLGEYVTVQETVISTSYLNEYNTYTKNGAYSGTSPYNEVYLIPSKDGTKGSTAFYIEDFERDINGNPNCRIMVSLRALCRNEAYSESAHSSSSPVYMLSDVDGLNAPVKIDVTGNTSAYYDLTDYITDGTVILYCTDSSKYVAVESVKITSTDETLTRSASMLSPLSYSEQTRALNSIQNADETEALVFGTDFDISKYMFTYFGYKFIDDSEEHHNSVVEDEPVIDDPIVEPKEESSISIVKFGTVNEVLYKTSVTFYADANNATNVEWHVDGATFTVNKSNNSCTVQNPGKTFTVKCSAKDADGKTITSDTQTVKVKNTFFDKIKAIFKFILNKFNWPTVNQGSAAKKTK